MLILLAWACTPTVEKATISPPQSPIVYPRPTTNGSLAAANLDLRIKNLAKIEGQERARIDSLGMRASLFGQVSDYDRMLTIAREDSLRSQPLLALHRFDEALTYDGKVAESVSLAREESLESLASTRQALVNTHPSTTSWQRLGDVLGAQGNTHAADVAYWEALSAYRDVSPFVVAGIQFRRGLLWGEDHLDDARARALYTDAVKRVPGFVRAQVHLAELEWRAGDHRAAIARVRKVAKSEDPEPGGKLALWLEGEEAQKWQQRTTRAYDRLLSNHSLAFSDHAAEYFDAIGEHKRAGKLALINLNNRSTRRAKELCQRTHCSP